MLETLLKIGEWQRVTFLKIIRTLTGTRTRNSDYGILRYIQLSYEGYPCFNGFMNFITQVSILVFL